MAAKIILAIITIVYLAFNFLTAMMMSAREMKSTFVDGECIVGQVFVNLFYLPAWFLKVARYAMLRIIK